MRNKILLFLLIFTLQQVRGQETSKTNSIIFGLGYGGTYNYKGKQLTGIKDNNHFSIDWIYKDRFGIGLNYDKPFLYDYFKLKEFTLAAKYFPFAWYNQPFIGVSYTMGKYDIGDAKLYPYDIHGSGNHNAFGICWGLKIQFPKNFFIIFEVNNILNGYTGVIKDTHTMYVNGILAYRINFKPKRS